jgi:hypothetical protein
VNGVVYLVPHEWKNERKEGPSLSGHKDQKVPKRRISLVAPSLANVADAAGHSWPIQRQLMIEASHQDLHAEESHLKQSRPVVAARALLLLRMRSTSAVDAQRSAPRSITAAANSANASSSAEASTAGGTANGTTSRSSAG